MIKPKIVIIDGQNFLHRSRAGLQVGQFNIVFNFFRGLRSLLQQLQPTRVYFTLEGHPQKRHELFPEYKANRKIDLNNEKKVQELENFWRQRDLILELLKEHFPLNVVRHPNFEADDVIFNLIESSWKSIPWIVVSSDSDFTQLLENYDHVQIYNPMKKKYVERFDDYVIWKALRGDPSDNIPGLPKIGDKRALELVQDREKLRELLSDSTMLALFERNVNLIKFERWTEEESLLFQSSLPIKNWDVVKRKFEEWEFKSITDEPAWSKFIATFDVLFA